MTDPIETVRELHYWIAGIEEDLPNEFDLRDYAAPLKTLLDEVEHSRKKDSCVIKQQEHIWKQDNRIAALEKALRKVEWGRSPNHAFEWATSEQLRDIARAALAGED